MHCKRARALATVVVFTMVSALAGWLKWHSPVCIYIRCTRKKTHACNRGEESRVSVGRSENELLVNTRSHPLLIGGNWKGKHARAARSSELGKRGQGMGGRRVGERNKMTTRILSKRITSSLRGIVVVVVVVDIVRTLQSAIVIYLVPDGIARNPARSPFGQNAIKYKHRHTHTHTNIYMLMRLIRTCSSSAAAQCAIRK